MIIELIPVIEIGYNNQGVTTPNQYPYWDNFEIWDIYHEECYQKAGFKDKLVSYSKGSYFYRASEISGNNLTKIIIDHTQEMRDGKYERQQAPAFFGGYVLQVDGQDKYFPQCCGKLSDKIIENHFQMAKILAMKNTLLYKLNLKIIISYLIFPLMSSTNLFNRNLQK